MSELFILCTLAFASITHAQYLPTAPILPEAPAPEEDPANEEKEAPEIPAWLKDLSNLPVKERDVYTSSFTAAKQAYSQGRLTECESYLISCSLILDNNPNVWNLMAGVRIAQKHFDEALPLLQKVNEALPEDEICQVNYSLLYLGKGDYEKCLEITDGLLEKIQYKRLPQLRDCMIYRKVLCLLMLDRQDEAKELTGSLSPLDDSPLYYYSQAAYNIVGKNRSGATSDLNAADAIFASEGYLLSYKQSLIFSGLIGRFLNATDAP